MLITNYINQCCCQRSLKYIIIIRKTYLDNVCSKTMGATNRTEYNNDSILKVTDVTHNMIPLQNDYNTNILTHKVCA